MIPLVPWKWRCLLKTSFLVIFISNLLKNLPESFLSSRQLHINLVWPEFVHVDATLWIYWGWKRWCYFLWTTFAPNWSNFSIFNIFNILSYIKYMTHFVKTWYNKESIHQRLLPCFRERPVPFRKAASTDSVAARVRPMPGRQNRSRARQTENFLRSKSRNSRKTDSSQRRYKQFWFTFISLAWSNLSTVFIALWSNVCRTCNYMRGVKKCQNGGFVHRLCSLSWQLVLLCRLAANQGFFSLIHMGGSDPLDH